MKALFFISCRLPGSEAAGRVTTPSQGAGSPAPAGGVEGSSVGRAPFSPDARAGAVGASGGACGAGAALLNSSPLPTRLHPGWSERSPDAASNVAIEEAQHFEKIVVKSVIGEVWFRRDRQHDIINEVAVEDRCFDSQRLQRHRVGQGMDSKGLDVCNSLEQDKACWRCCCRYGRKEDSWFCSPSRSVYVGPNFTKHHGTKSPLQRPCYRSSFFEPCALIV